MPPKPRIRMPAKPAPVAKARSIPPLSVKPAPKVSPVSQSSRATAPPPRMPWHQNANLRFNARWVGYIILGGCAVLWIRDHYIDLTPVKGTSMAPTINPTEHETGKNDYLFIRPYSHSAATQREEGENENEEPRGVKRGDVVTFWKPHKPEELGIKRIIAVEGDTVYPQRGYTLDAKVLARPRLQGMPDGLPDHDEDSIMSGREEAEKTVVPYGHVWVEGDNAHRSLDSRDVGPISKSLIDGKAVWIWRGWGEFLRVEDARSKKAKSMGSRVVKGKAEIPTLFLE